MNSTPLYIGVDFHVRKQWVAWSDCTTGELGDQLIFGDQLILHNGPELDRFYHRFIDRQCFIVNSLKIYIKLSIGIFGG